MIYPIKFTYRAIDELDSIVQYIMCEFGFLKAETVKNDYKQIIDQITHNPNQFPYFSKRKKIRKCVISPQTSLYYRFDGEVVHLLSFRSNFMNPRTRNL